jgi:peptidoglycan L-alanyl-D-glutamate endopeptidase CwlK
MDAVSEMRLGGVAPALGRLIRQLASNLSQEGIYLRVVQALRTSSEQDGLYAQGRTKSGNIVTNVRGGYSYHNFGLAVDVVPSQFGPDRAYAPDWNLTHSTWGMMENAGKALGMVSGSDFCNLPDAPHFQLNGPWPIAEPPDEVRNLAASGGLVAVWQAANAL